MPTTTIIFEVTDSRARAAFEQLQRELNETARDMGGTQRSADKTGAAVERLGTTSQRTGQRLRDTRAQFIAASGGADTFAKSLGRVRGVLTGLGATPAAHGVAEFFANVTTQSELAINANALRTLAAADTTARTSTADATKTVENFSLTLAKLRAEAEETRHTLTTAVDVQQVTPNFQAAIAASDAYAHARITAAQKIVDAEKEGSETYKQLQTVHTETFESVTADIQTATETMQGFINATQLALQTQLVYDRHRRDEADSGSLFAEPRDVVPRIPRTQRTAPLDTTPDIFAERLKQIAEEERAVQQSLRRQTAAYRRFGNLVSNTFVTLATGRSEGFEQVATAFIQQSLRIIARAYVEYDIRKRLDSQLTASKLANIQRVVTAQQAGELAGNGAGSTGIGSLGNLLGNIPGLGNIGSLLSGGGATALGVSALLFPQESNNLLQGIRDEIGGFIASVADVPDKAFGTKQQVFLKIGENEVRDITDIQADLRAENRV